MFKAIMAVDDKGGISRDGSMPWPKNSSDLKWFKKNTLNAIVIMGRATWEDPFMPSPLINRLNILVTNQDKKKYPGADEYISGNIIDSVINLTHKYSNKDFYITRIYGDFDCDKKIDLNMINRSMKMVKKIDNDETCHFEIWKK